MQALPYEETFRNDGDLCFFAEVPVLVDRLPEPDPDRPGVLVLDVGELHSVGTTPLKQVGRYSARLAAAGSALVLTGIRPELRAVLADTGLLARLDDENVLPHDPHLGAALEAGRIRGEEAPRELQARRARAD